MSQNLVPTREWANLYGEGLKIDGELIAAARSWKCMMNMASCVAQDWCNPTAG